MCLFGLSINGRKFNDFVIDNRTEIDTNLSNALVDMNAKCGDLDRAVDLFNDIHPSERNASSWSVLISGGDTLYNQMLIHVATVI